MIKRLSSFIVILSLISGCSNFNNETVREFSQEVDNDFFKNLVNKKSFINAGVFLYESNYENRYVISSKAPITNKNVNIKTDSFYPLLLNYHKNNICILEHTEDLPKDSNIYKYLLSQGLISKDIYYIACPILHNKTRLIGYVSAYVYQEKQGIVENLLKVQYVAKLVEENLDEIL